MEQGELYVKNFGNFLGSETFNSILKFKLRCPNDAARIQKAYLTLSVKKDRDLNGIKEAYILLFAENTWTGENARWSDFIWQFANRTGLSEPDNFNVEPGFDFEYFFQRVRFMYFSWAMTEYVTGGDEQIPYALLKTMYEFILAQGHERTYCKNWHIGMGWYDDESKSTLCGGWPRALDASIRIAQFAVCLPYLTQTKWMTAEIFCCVLKYIRDALYGIVYKSKTQLNSNLRMFELSNALRGISVYREFSGSEAWLQDAARIIKQMMYAVTFEDGTYMEATGGYSQSVCSHFVDFLKFCDENHIEIEQEFHKRLQKFAMYNVLLEGPGGESLQYGDQGAAVYEGWQYPALIQRYQNDVLDYILTRGQIGKKPNFTSYRFEKSSATMLRDSWSEKASYIWTQARGGGSHGHQDDNHITLISEGRVLLTDAGIFTYSSEDAYRQWGVSPIAHNTVAINNLPQRRGSGTGGCRVFYTDERLDIVSQISQSYEGFRFTRTITWYKPDIIIVDDLIEPENETEANTYRQAWHMMPTAEMIFCREEKAVSSNYKKGVNVRIHSLDADCILREENGWYDYGYQQLAPNRFACFVKEKKKGRVSFKTLIEIIR